MQVRTSGSVANSVIHLMSRLLPIDAYNASQTQYDASFFIFLPPLRAEFIPRRFCSAK